MRKCFLGVMLEVIPSSPPFNVVVPTLYVCLSETEVRLELPHTDRLAGGLRLVAFLAILLALIGWRPYWTPSPGGCAAARWSLW